MKWAIAIAALLLLGSLSQRAEADTTPGDRRWLALALVSLLNEDSSPESGVFYSSEHQFEPGLLVRMQPKRRLSLAVGITEGAFALGPSLRVGKSRFYLTGGVASEQERLSTFPFACVSWRWRSRY